MGNIMGIEWSIWQRWWRREGKEREREGERQGLFIWLGILQWIISFG